MVKLTERKSQAPLLCGRLPRPRVSFCVCNSVIISLKTCLPSSVGLIQPPQAYSLSSAVVEVGSIASLGGFGMRGQR